MLNIRHGLCQYGKHGKEDLLILRILVYYVYTTKYRLLRKPESYLIFDGFTKTVVILFHLFQLMSHRPSHHKKEAAFEKDSPR